MFRFRKDFRNIGDMQCNFSIFFLMFTSMNASGHLVGLAVDRVLILSDTIWHHSITWRRKIPLISLGMGVFHFLLLAPRVCFFDAKEGKCEMKSDAHMAAKVYEILLVTVFLTFSHFSAVFVATILFVKNLRKRRHPLESMDGASSNHCSNNELVATTGSRKCLPTKTLDRVEEDSDLVGPINLGWSASWHKIIAEIT